MKIFALHGFLGLPTDWKIFDLSHQAVDLFDTQFASPQKGLKAWASSFNRKIEPSQKNILIGYSLGGRLALHCLLDNPALWSGAILVSTHPGLKTAIEKEVRLAQDLKWADKFLHDPWQSLMSEWNSQPVFEQSKSIVRPQKHYSRELLAETLEYWSLGQQDDLGDAVNALKIPVTWIVGERDQKYVDLTAGFKQQVVVKGAGHRVPWDTPAQFNDLIAGITRE